MWLLNGRSRQASRKPRSERSSKTSSSGKQRTGEEEEVAVPKPDLEELRKRRSEYYRDPAAARKRVSSSGTLKSTSSKRSTAASSSLSASERQRRHKRKQKSSSSKADTTVDESQKETEDYVYRPRIPQEVDVSPGRVQRDEDERPRPARKTSNHSSSSRRRSLPTVFEAEVTPDDSISQVGARRLSVREKPIISDRPSIKRSRTTSSKLPPISEIKTSETPSISTSRKSTAKHSSSSGFSRRHSTSSLPTKPRLVDCLTCGSDDIPSTKSAKLACGHRMCHECLKRVFELSVNDPQHMPPRCCQEEHIPLKHVDKLFDVKFKTLWNRKYQEYHTRDRIYCTNLKCGEWIKPSHIHTSGGRKYALCPRCKTKVCTLCNSNFHKSGDCPKDPEIAKLVEQAKEQGWQRCYSCNALVEKNEGCNHITCRCTAQFCILCGAQWKTCQCPWFPQSNLAEPDYLNYMRVPGMGIDRFQRIYRQFFGDAADPAVPPLQPPQPHEPQLPPNDVIRDHRENRARLGRLPEYTYQQELDERRRQEQLDADLARRLQYASILEPGEGHTAGDRNRVGAELWGVGNAGDNFMNDDFVQNAANVVMSTFGDTNLGRRGERASGRRRRAAQAAHADRHGGLAPNFLGDESVLGL